MKPSSKKPSHLKEISSSPYKNTEENERRRADKRKNTPDSSNKGRRLETQSNDSEEKPYVEIRGKPEGNGRKKFLK